MLISYDISLIKEWLTKFLWPQPCSLISTVETMCFWSKSLKSE